MFAVDGSGNPVYNFYVRNQYDQVFKCLWNAGVPSTVEPYFEPGSFGTNNIYLGADGYKWKFMYTIDTGTKVKFMNADWLPVPVGANTPNPLTSSAGAGNIDVINVIFVKCIKCTVKEKIVGPNLLRQFNPTWCWLG